MKKIKEWLKWDTIEDWFKIVVNTILYLLCFILAELICILGIFLRVTGRLW